MSAKITVPELGESVVEATVARWLKKEGDRVNVGEPLVELETEKVDLEVGATEAGVLASIEADEGTDVQIGAVLAVIEAAGSEEAGSAEAGGDAHERDARSAEPAEPADDDDERPPEDEGVAEDTRAGPSGGAAEQARQGEAAAAGRASTGKETRPAREARKAREAEPRTEARSDKEASKVRARDEDVDREAGDRLRATASARKLAQKRGVDLSELDGTGDSGRITRKDVERALKEARRSAAPGDEDAAGRADLEERVRLSRRRQTIARRLVEAQRTAAMLTTFNEVDMSQIVAIRRRHKEAFSERHGVGLGISSFFVKATVSALRAFPRLNAEIQGDEMVLKRYYDIGIAVGAREGLVVPVVRDADRLGFAEIEGAIKTFVQKAEDGELTYDDLKGGTFTITNGGVFGSLLSTPILNPPQVGILGLHKIEERAVPVDGRVAIRPMMYLALSYDHRIVDGREAVQFLVYVKELIEDPAGMLFG